MGMNVEFTMDPNWERNVMKAADGHLRKLAADFACDHLTWPHFGRRSA